MKKTLMKYTMTILIGACISIFVLYLRNVFTMTDTKEIYKALADSFTIPGVLFICFGCLLLISNSGGLNAIGFLLKNLVKTLIPLGQSGKKHESYEAYCENKKKISGFAFLFYIGLFYILLAVLFVTLYY